MAGYPAGQPADYLAMLSLSEAEAPGDCATLQSILDLISTDCAQKPGMLTEADKAYLTGLYAIDTGQIGSLQNSAIANHMLREAGS